MLLFWLAWVGGPGSIDHFSSRLKLSVSLKFHVGPVHRTVTIYTAIYASRSFILHLVVLIAVSSLCLHMSVLSRRVPQALLRFLLSSFIVSKSSFVFFSQLVSLTAPTHTNSILLLRIQTWPFCNHISRMRNKFLTTPTRRICVLVTSLVTAVRFPRLRLNHYMHILLLGVVYPIYTLCYWTPYLDMWLSWI